MWPWELKPRGLSTSENELYEGPHLFTALYRFYKASFWGVGIHIGPNHPVYPKGFLTSFLNLPTHLQEKILNTVWNNGEDFNEIIIRKGYPRLRVDLRFMFLIYSQHKADSFPISKFGYGCWNGGLFSKNQARFYYGPFDPCSSVNIPEFSESSLQGKTFVDFAKLCLNGRRQIVKHGRQNRT
jgi:hypothetical protein